MFEIRKVLTEVFGRGNVLEQLPDGRTLYSSGEIFDSNKKLWGYRLYKGVSGGAWDDEQQAYLQPSVSSREEYESLLQAAIRRIEKEGNLVEKIWGYTNNLTPLEQLALAQAGKSRDEYPCYSWTRDPHIALSLSKPPHVVSTHTGGKILQIDIPQNLCISQEKLRSRTIKNNKGNYPLETVVPFEREVTIFDYIGPGDNRVTVYDAQDLEKKLPSLPFSPHFIEK